MFLPCEFNHPKTLTTNTVQDAWFLIYILIEPIERELAPQLALRNMEPHH